MNTQDGIVLLRKLEAAWPNIFAKNPEREQLFLDVLTPCDYSKSAKTIGRLIGEMKLAPSLAELKQALSKDVLQLEPETKTFTRPGLTLLGNPVASYEQAKLAFARGYRKAKPQATDEQIQQIFGKMNIQKQESEIF